MRIQGAAIAVLLLCHCAVALPQSGGTADALFKAAESGNAAEIGKLLGQGAPVNAQDPTGWTPLMVAAGEGKLAAVQALVKAGANVNAASKKGETALMASVLSGNVAVVNYLLAAGADKSAATAKGLTAGDMAAQAKKPEIAKLLASAGKSSPATGAASTKQANAKEAAAVEAYQKGRYEEAAGLFKELVGIDPKNAPAWFFLGQSLEKSGQKAEARSAYEKSLQLQPSGEFADRTRKLVAGTQREALLKDLDLSAETREVLATSPLIASLPDTPAIKCDAQRIYDGKPWLTTSSYERGSAGIARSIFSSSYEGQPKTITPYVVTLGGSAGLTKAKELISVNGSFFPLKPGNRFSYVLRDKAGDSGQMIIIYACQVLEPVQTPGLGFPNRSNDVYRLKCEAKGQYRGGVLDGKEAAGYPISIYRLCSNSMGLCPYQWGAEEGTAIPDFAGGYTRTNATGSKIFFQKRCEVVP